MTRFHALASVLCLALVSTSFGAAMLALWPSLARASPGLYVATSDTAPRTHASTVVLMREGEHTVLSMQSDYEGPSEGFAWIVPLPAGVVASDVRALDPALIARVERTTGARLDERWEADPCPRQTYDGWGSSFAPASTRTPSSGVRIETELATGEYDVVVLGADDTRSLEGWLHAHDYRVPTGLSEALAPHVASGANLLVARVDPERVRFENGRALPSPLRVRYESADLVVPLRLGALSAADVEDLVVVVIARNQRYEAASHPNVFVPTNLDVAPRVRDDFGAFYEALLDRTLEEHPGAVITEHSGPAAGCDPCPTNATLDAETLSMLGGDVLYAGGVQRGAPYAGGPRVRMGATTAQGLSAEAARRVIRRHINELRFCYEQELTSSPHAGGVVEARIEILPTGAVRDAAMTAAAGAALGERTTSCLASAARRWTFPTPSNDGTAQITTTLTFGDPRTSHAGDAPTAYESELVATRLRVRTGRDAQDLVLRPADPVTGGREVRDDRGRLGQSASPASANTFQARYVIRHAWMGAIACENPTRGEWSGRPLGADPAGPASLPPEVAPAHAREAPHDVALDEVVLDPASAEHPGRAAPPSAADDAPHEGGCTAAHAPRQHTSSGLMLVLACGLLANRRRARVRRRRAFDA
jgi:hypothetical protein